jgi:hypothetical protein
LQPLKLKSGDLQTAAGFFDMFAALHKGTVLEYQS